MKTVFVDGDPSQSIVGTIVDAAFLNAVQNHQHIVLDGEGQGGEIPNHNDNLLINSNFAVNQRGYVSGAATGVPTQYTLDRWRVVTSGQNLAFSTTNGVGTITAPAGGVEQVVEGVSIIGGTYTLSWVGTATATVGGGALANGGQITLVGGGGVIVRFSGGTVSKPKLEAGGVATPYKLRPYQQELALCQRYYEIGSGACTSYGVAGNSLGYYVGFKVTKRATPTITGAQTSTTNCNNFAYSAVNQDGLHPTCSIIASGQWTHHCTWTASAEL